MTEQPKIFARGAKPTPRHKLAAAMPHVPVKPIPSQMAYIPTKLSYWLNQTDGDCVTAEEAFNKDASGIFIDDSTVQAWASARGFLNGAMLTDVMDDMAATGFSQGGDTYGDGPYVSVDYSNEQILQSALSHAPVKIGIDADALPQSAGRGNGWHAFGGRHGQYRNEDHCVSLCGYGPVTWLFEKLGVPVPNGTDPKKTGYLLFTWSSIGVVDYDWLMSTCGEAWLRNASTTVNGVALTNPGD